MYTGIKNVHFQEIVNKACRQERYTPAWTHGQKQCPIERRIPEKPERHTFCYPQQARVYSSVS